jgi:hypothetical protein
MKFIKLKPVVMTYTETFEYSVDDYVEDCEDDGIVPSQKHYERMAKENFIANMLDDTDTDNITFSYSQEQICVYKERKVVKVKEDFDQNTISDFIL